MRYFCIKAQDKLWSRRHAPRYKNSASTFNSVGITYSLFWFNSMPLKNASDRMANRSGRVETSRSKRRRCWPRDDHVMTHVATTPSNWDIGLEKVQINNAGWRYTGGSIMHSRTTLALFNTRLTKVLFPDGRRRSVIVRGRPTNDDHVISRIVRWAADPILDVIGSLYVTRSRRLVAMETALTESTEDAI